MRTLSKPTVRKCLAYFLIFLTLFSSNSCNYFRINSIPEGVNETTTFPNHVNNRYIVHAAGQIMEMNEFNFDPDNKEFFTAIVQEPVSKVNYTEGRSDRYRLKEKAILNEVHFYLRNTEPLPTGQVTIPFTAIKEVKIIDVNGGKTVLSYAVGTVIVLASIYVILIILVALLKSSCPYVYVYDGTSYVFEGETFGGAIAQNLERDDYMPLPSAKSDLGLYRLRISNELKEKQYTDIAELMVVDHPEGSSVLLDKEGTPRLITAPRSALSAVSCDGTDFTKELAAKDTSVFMYNTGNAENGLILRFKNENRNSSAKLILRGKNTLWFDWLYGEFIGKFGSSYDNWMDKQSKLPVEERMQSIMKSEIPLCIYLKKGDKWQLVDYLMTVGPLACRDFVVPVDLPEADEIIEIKLETGFMFWETDYAAMDFSKDEAMKVNSYKPESASGTGNHDWKQALSETDGVYMEQITPGLRTDLIFNTNNGSSEKTLANKTVESVFLHTRGYYELIRNFEGAPQVTELYKFKSPGYFSEFSRQTYYECLEGEYNLANKN